MRIAFAGTPEFARIALARIDAAGFAMPLVLTQPDRPAGRGLQLVASPVKAFAVEHGVSIAQPRSLRLDGKFVADAERARAALHEAEIDVLVVAAYGLILPAWVLALPRLGCINIHASRLPRWRGAAPIQRAIEAGDAETGVTIMQMDEGLDTGAMLMTQSVPIAADATSESLFTQLAELGGHMIVEVLQRLAIAPLPAEPQPEVGATYANKILKSEAAIDWRLPAAVIERRLRAFDPFPGATATLRGELIKCWRGDVVDTPVGRRPGTLTETHPHGLRVACGEHSLQLTTLQRAGGKRLTVHQFLQATPLIDGMQFELPPS